MEESGPSQKNQVIGVRVSHREIPLSGTQVQVAVLGLLGNLPGVPASDPLNYQCLQDLGACWNGEA